MQAQLKNFSMVARRRRRRLAQNLGINAGDKLIENVNGTGSFAPPGYNRRGGSISFAGIHTSSYSSSAKLVVCYQLKNIGGSPLRNIGLLSRTTAF